MAVDECCGSVVFAEQAAIDVVEPIPGDEPVPAGGTCETLWGGGTVRKSITTRPADEAVLNSIMSHIDLTTVCAGVW